ncbi:hypothetical protein MF4836_19680 [Pseudomonas sp. MF4836]|nr:hypothetical protein MF4836_19680 [Pseudomonas sp. MF4836]
MATFELNRGGLILFIATLGGDGARYGVFEAQSSWKWSYRKRRSIHDRALPRETLIARPGPLVAAPGRFHLPG